MKKLALYFSMAMALFLGTACSDDYDDWADPMSYPQEDAITIPGFQATAVGTIDLNNAASDSSQLYTLSTAALPDGYTLSNARIVLVPQEATTATTTTQSTTLVGVAPNSDLQSMVQTNFGLRPVERTYAGHVYVNAVKNGEAVLIDAGTVNVVVVPKAPVIEEAYYITGTVNGWNNSNTDYELSNGGADPYENPVFTVTIPASAVTSDLEFKVTPKSGLGGDWTKCLAAPADGTEGKFVTDNGGGNGLNFKIPMSADAKLYRISFNMLDQTWSYTCMNFAEYIYEIGNSTKWSGVVPLSSPAFSGIYKGFGYLDGEFKFKPNEGDWNGDWGQDPNGAAGTLVQEGEVNCTVATAGYYMMDVDLINMTWKVTPVTTIGVIGSFESSGWSSDVAMTYNVAGGYWEADVTLAAGDEFKFRANGGWDINWGGTEDNLVQSGANLKATEAGTYNMKLYALCDGKAHVTVTKK